jgi:hypothetical protein
VSARLNAPRPWIPLDVEFLSQDTVIELRDRFGAAGPLLLIALITQAGGMLAGKDGRATMGFVEGRYAALAKRCGVDQEAAKAIVAGLVDVRLVGLLDGSDDQHYRLRLLKWLKWHTKDPTANARQAKHRGPT